MIVTVKTGDALRASEAVEAILITGYTFGIPKTTTKRFSAGESMGTVTNPSRSLASGITYVDFQDANGNNLFVDKALINTGKVSVQSAATTDYSTLGKVAGTGTNTAPKTTVFDKVLDVLGTIGGIFNKSKTTPPINNDGSGSTIDVDFNNGSGTKEPAPQQSNNTLWYVIGGLVLLVGGIIGFIAYQKSKKRKAQANA